MKEKRYMSKLDFWYTVVTVGFGGMGLWLIIWLVSWSTPEAWTIRFFIIFLFLYLLGSYKVRDDYE